MNCAVSTAMNLFARMFCFVSIVCFLCLIRYVDSVSLHLSISVCGVKSIFLFKHIFVIRVQCNIFFCFRFVLILNDEIVIVVSMMKADILQNCFNESNKCTADWIYLSSSASSSSSSSSKFSSSPNSSPLLTVKNKRLKS